MNIAKSKINLKILFLYFINIKQIVYNESNPKNKTKYKTVRSIYFLALLARM